jgi:serpin B
MSAIKANKVEISSEMTKGNKAYTDFALELFKRSLSEDRKNTLVSPLSVIYALGLTANGADENTLRQMEQVFGISSEELNEYLYLYTKMKESESNGTLNIANSIWFANSISPKNDFLQKNADFYNAAAYKSDFTDKQTVSDINNWVNLKTKGMIPHVINEIDPLTVMFLINALAFEAEWRTPYYENAVRDDEFFLEDGRKATVEFMYSSDGRYISDGAAKGFIKNYKGNYAFVAILPEEGTTVEEYISSLTGEKLSKLLESQNIFSNYDLITSLPKFDTDYSLEMKDILKSMGMTDAFDSNVSNFSKMADINGLKIGSVIHKTFISVGELGTKAGAVTAVVMDAECAPVEPPEKKEVYLNRPFVYMLLDTTTSTPFFIGTMKDPE